MKLLLLLYLLFHICGGIITIFIFFKTGCMRHAAKYGDGFRFCKPSELVFLSFVVWEIFLIIAISDYISIKINDYFDEKYKT